MTIYSKFLSYPSAIRHQEGWVWDEPANLHFGLSFAMAIHSLNTLEMPLLASAFSSVLPNVTCGQPAGREFATQLVSNFRDVATNL